MMPLYALENMKVYNKNKNQGPSGSPVLEWIAAYFEPCFWVIEWITSLGNIGLEN
jgi:hypothetical protein